MQLVSIASEPWWILTMASSSKYNLKWNSHHTEAFHGFETLRSREVLVDVTLMCEGQSLKAHKLVLCAGSGYFERVLQRDSHHNPMMYFFGVDVHLLKFLVDFMYIGEVDIPSIDLEKFIQLAEVLEVKGLKGDHSKKSYSVGTATSTGTTIPVSDVQHALSHKRKAAAWQSYNEGSQHSKTSRRSQEMARNDGKPSNLLQENGPLPKKKPESTSWSASGASPSVPSSSAPTKEEPVIKDEVVDIVEEETIKNEEHEQPVEQEDWDAESQTSYYQDPEGEEAALNNLEMPQNVPAEINPASTSWSASGASPSVPSSSAPTKEEPVIKDEVVDIVEEETIKNEEHEQPVEQEDWDAESQTSYYQDPEGEEAALNNLEMPQNVPAEINPATLKAEMQFIWSGKTWNDMRLHLCGVCGYRSPNKTHVMYHIHTHTGARPYHCQECGRSFSQKAHLNRHKISHLNIS
ncbi:unnamed protein product [Darwinula stevensoni]|uniref:Uncharacterized protein n=1 Tax=Darwinula stevensoni TaxID=69355 RepID=A0A7R9A7A5_9CRUS|nr:unnamed protein product [Darwinula stevensoni]CAG0890924.1 unnamed protein product [Darwinula stevensoni]